MASHLLGSFNDLLEHYRVIHLGHSVAQPIWRQILEHLSKREKQRNKEGSQTQYSDRLSSMVTYLGKASLSTISTLAIQAMLLLRVPGTQTEKSWWQTWSVAETGTVLFIRAILTVAPTVTEVLPRNASLSVPTGDRGSGAKQRAQQRKRRRGDCGCSFNPRIWNRELLQQVSPLAGELHLPTHKRKVKLTQSLDLYIKWYLRPPSTGFELGQIVFSF